MENGSITNAPKSMNRCVSARDYDEYQRLKTTALAVEELDDATLKALATSRMDQRHYK